MRDLQSLCDRLGEMFEGDGITPDALSVEAREAIEELWQERDRQALKLDEQTKQAEYNGDAARSAAERLVDALRLLAKIRDWAAGEGFKPTDDPHKFRSAIPLALFIQACELTKDQPEQPK